MRSAWRVVAGSPAARLGIAAVAVGHLVMVAVMAMTPVRLGESHGDADVLRMVGIVLSLHIAGMYALSPLVGWLTDRLGRRAVILGGVGAAAGRLRGGRHRRARHAPALGGSGPARAGLVGDDGGRLDAAVRVGAGGRTAERAGAVRPDHGAGRGRCRARPAGLSMQVAGYPALTLLAAVATVPLLALALRPVPTGGTGRGGADQVRLTDFWTRLEEAFGPGYAASIARDQVLSQLDGRTVDQALAAG